MPIFFKEEMHSQKYACIGHAIIVAWEPGFFKAQPEKDQCWPPAGDEAC